MDAAKPTGRRAVLENLTPFLLLGGLLFSWFALQKWILPRFGIAT